MMRARLAALTVAALLLGTAAHSQDTRPSIVLIMAEDLSPRLGAYGDPVARTPVIDRLASEGARYTRAYTTAGVCAPSRAAIIMGVEQNEWGAGHMRAAQGGYAAVPPEGWKAFPELLRAAGYWVVNNGKTDYQMAGGNPLLRAFGGPSSIWDETAGDDWRGRAPGQPFFAYLTLANTHESQVWPTWHLFSISGLLMAPLRIPNHLSWEFETDPLSVSLPPYYLDTETVRDDIARHYNNIGNVDRGVAEILAKLEEDGVADNTLVMFAGDHGDGLPRAKRWLYDSGTWIPLLVRWPGHVVPDTVETELVSGLDLAPTFLRAAGVDVPARMQGRVIVGPERAPPPPVLYAARDRMDESADTVRSVRDERYLYIRNLHPERPYVLDIAFRDETPMMQEMRARAEAGTLPPRVAQWFRSTRDPEELYDTTVDPHQMKNLAADSAYEDVVARFRTLLDERLSQGRDLGLLPEEALKERFWPGGEEPVTSVPEVSWRGRTATVTAAHQASIEVRLDEDGPWSLYVEPVEVGPGQRLEARAVRYGWAGSEVRDFEPDGAPSER